MPINWSLMRSFGRWHTFWYRMTGGRFGTGRLMMFGPPVLLLTTTGRRSGAPRTAPLLYLLDGDDVVVVGSAGGNDTHPTWYLNLKSNPEAEVQIGGERRRVRAEVVEGPERARLWPKLVDMYSGYARYQEGTQRKIPVIKLRRSGDGVRDGGPA